MSSDRGWWDRVLDRLFAGLERLLGGWSRRPPCNDEFGHVERLRDEQEKEED